jgi:hypothetical protein
MPWTPGNSPSSVYNLLCPQALPQLEQFQAAVFDAVLAVGADLLPPPGGADTATDDAGQVLAALAAWRDGVKAGRAAQQVNSSSARSQPSCCS